MVSKVSGAVVGGGRGAGVEDTTFGVDLGSCW